MYDYVFLKTKKGDFEGFVLPRSEFHQTGFITLKLKDGYNLSIKKSDIIKMKKLGKKEVIERFPKAKLKKTKNPNISLISTGGTIASRVDYVTGGVKMALSPEEILFVAPEITEFANVYSISEVSNIASEDMNPDVWIKLAKSVVRELNRGARGVVITHGTDTLHYTSSALSFMVESSKPVILTGAQRSTDRGSSDTFLNLLCSFITASRSDLGETAIVFHENLEDEYCFALRGTRARKMHTERRDAFRPINSLPLLRIKRKGEIEKISEYKKYEEGKARVRGGFEKKTGLLKVYPGSDPSILSYYIDKKYRGVIIEGTGFGHVPTNTLEKKYSWIPAIKKMVRQGIFVGMTSQTIYGRTNSRVYRNLRILSKAGAIHLGDMLPETAYVKLGWALSLCRDVDETKELMLKNVAGEISERTDERWFLI